MTPHLCSRDGIDAMKCPSYPNWTPTPPVTAPGASRLGGVAWHLCLASSDHPRTSPAENKKRQAGIMTPPKPLHHFDSTWFDPTLNPDRLDVFPSLQVPRYPDTHPLCKPSSRPPPPGPSHILSYHPRHRPRSCPGPRPRNRHISRRIIPPHRWCRRPLHLLARRRHHTPRRRGGIIPLQRRAIGAALAAGAVGAGAAGAGAGSGRWHGSGEGNGGWGPVKRGWSRGKGGGGGPVRDDGVVVLVAAEAAAVVEVGEEGDGGAGECDGEGDGDVNSYWGSHCGGWGRDCSSSFCLFYT